MGIGFELTLYRCSPVQDIVHVHGRDEGYHGLPKCDCVDLRPAICVVHQIYCSAADMKCIGRNTSCTLGELYSWIKGLLYSRELFFMYTSKKFFLVQVHKDA